MDNELIQRDALPVSESFMTDTESQLTDGFGHAEYGASKTVVTNCGKRTQPTWFSGKRPGNRPSSGCTAERRMMHASTVDRKALILGRKAVEFALSGVNARW